jgi:dTDP-4-dehydrorhamnose reductase
VRILLTGADGQVGWELRRTLATVGEVIAPDLQQLDLANADAIRRVTRDVRPALIVNPAAYTAVDKAEQEPDLAMRVNGVAPGVLAEEAKSVGALLVHYSTDYVFDGRKQGAYSEDDLPNPLNVYGVTKLAGERAVAASGASYLVLRTSWVYGLRGRNFLRTMLRLGAEREELRVVDDQTGAPTWSRMLAVATAQILARLLYPASGEKARFADAKGIYHLSAGDHTTWYGFAGAIFAEAAKWTGLRVPALLPIATSDYPVAAVRPPNSVLSNLKLERDFGLRMAPWSTSLSLCLQELEKA